MNTKLGDILNWRNHLHNSNLLYMVKICKYYYLWKCYGRYDTSMSSHHWTVYMQFGNQTRHHMIEFRHPHWFGLANTWVWIDNLTEIHKYICIIDYCTDKACDLQCWEFKSRAMCWWMLHSIQKSCTFHNYCLIKVVPSTDKPPWHSLYVHFPQPNARKR